MSKAKEHHAADHGKTSPAHTAEAADAKGAGAKSDHKGGEHKPEAHKKADSSHSGGRHKHAEALPGNCHAWGCKAKSKQFDFCDEHFDHFKFGLIKKSGEQVSDYEKKIEHFMAYKSKQNVRKVA